VWWSWTHSLMTTSTTLKGLGWTPWGGLLTLYHAKGNNGKIIDHFIYLTSSFGFNPCCPIDLCTSPTEHGSSVLWANVSCKVVTLNNIIGDMGGKGKVCSGWYNSTSSSPIFTGSPLWTNGDYDTALYLVPHLPSSKFIICSVDICWTLDGPVYSTPTTFSLLLV
jgi:hypothetical protein